MGLKEVGGGTLNGRAYYFKGVGTRLLQASCLRKVIVTSRKGRGGPVSNNKSFRKNGTRISYFHRITFDFI